ncbi:hypothetical protein FNL56_09400 [Tardiphaga sp. vice304]|uniref:hypothetical protein n=1 Tax=unclassified Tardiphaga TaxID=2631404 RepID=UPI001163D125|nr:MULTISPECIES: hypothetical protein [unclassified Tardiphaga]QDM16071.1 hypothetical protein FNL53_09245 [Tardiphaga sp. vice278]QDM26279.1 hypothetical protein FNL56_09400 [Tardiphaga sp. vice304]
MTMIGRRTAIKTLGWGAMAISLARTDHASAAQETGTLVPSDGRQLRKLTDQLAHLPRRRDFKTVPMILTTTDQWDAAALDAVIAYPSPHKQVCVSFGEKRRLQAQISKIGSSLVRHHFKGRLFLLAFWRLCPRVALEAQLRWRRERDSNTTYELAVASAQKLSGLDC